MDRHQTDSSGLVPLSPAVVPRFFSLDCAYVWSVYQLASLRLMPPRGRLPLGRAFASSVQSRSDGKVCFVTRQFDPSGVLDTC